MLANDGCEEGGASIMASEVSRSSWTAIQKEKEMVGRIYHTHLC